MNGSPNLELVKSAYEALATRQLQKVLQLAAADFELEQSAALPWGGRYSGQEGLREFMVKLTQHLDSVMTPDTFVEAGDRIGAVGRTRGVAHRTGRLFDLQAIHVWTIRNGELSRFEAYVDEGALASALDGHGTRPTVV
jgi:ketosteroid isomerase-like protein